jgi:hypothetical protein
MFRALVRFSIDKDDGALTTQMRKLLEGAGFFKVGTGSYEHSGISGDDLGRVMRDYWRAIGNPYTAFLKAMIPPSVVIDHVWIHVDRL